MNFICNLHSIIISMVGCGLGPTSWGTQLHKIITRLCYQFLVKYCCVKMPGTWKSRNFHGNRENPGIFTALLREKPGFFTFPAFSRNAVNYPGFEVKYQTYSCCFSCNWNGSEWWYALLRSVQCGGDLGHHHYDYKLVDYNSIKGAYNRWVSKCYLNHD